MESLCTGLHFSTAAVSRRPSSWEERRPRTQLVLQVKPLVELRGRGWRLLPSRCTQFPGTQELCPFGNKARGTPFSRCGEEIGPSYVPPAQSPCIAELEVSSWRHQAQQQPGAGSLLWRFLSVSHITESQNVPGWQIHGPGMSGPWQSQSVKKAERPKRGSGVP